MLQAKRYFIFILFIFIVTDINAQNNDAQFWASVKIDNKILNRTTAYFEGGLRFSENFSETGIAYSEIGLDYKINKTIELSGGYRYFSKRINEDFYSVRHRFNLDVSVRKSYYLLNFQFRTRLQMEYKDIMTSVNGMIPDYKWLNKAQLKYNLTKKIKPYFYIESYNSLTTSKHTQLYDFTKMRYCVGAEYKINKHNIIEVYYLIENEYHQKNPFNNFVTGISFNHSF